jgi:hypothetical protein
MSKADAYRGYAADCIRLVQSVSSADVKAILLEMAAKWQRLAERAAKDKRAESREPMPLGPEPLHQGDGSDEQ